jgi:hypothetical protein
MNIATGGMRNCTKIKHCPRTVSWTAVYLPWLDEGWQESRWDLVSVTPHSFSHDSTKPLLRMCCRCLYQSEVICHFVTTCAFFFRQPSQWARASSFTRFLDHTQRRTTVGRIPLEEWSARRWDLYLHNTQHSQQTDIHAPDGIRTHSLSRGGVADGPRGHWDRQLVLDSC